MAPEHTITGPHAHYRANSGLAPRPATDGPQRREYSDFAQAYIDPAKPRQVSHIRRMRTASLLAEADVVEHAYARKVLSDHYEGTFLDGPFFNAAAPDFLSVCMHHSPGEFTWGDGAH